MPEHNSANTTEVRRMTTARSAIRIGIHAVVFLAAVVSFYFGLGVGLAFNPLLGTLLCIAAFAIAGLNLFLILRR